MEIHWAIFGERNGGHSLLSESGNRAFAVQITQYTDRPGDPPIGSVWGPVHAGFYFSGHYILLRTLPDPTAARAGMVRTFAAYIPNEKLSVVHNIGRVFQELPSSLEMKLSPTKPLHIPDHELPVHDIPKVPGLMEIAVRIAAGNPSLPIIWTWANDYLPLIAALWARLPYLLRKAFAFAFQFAPEYNLPVKPLLIATLPSLAGRWPPEKILAKKEKDTFNLTIAQRWLAGEPGDINFNQVLSDYGIIPETFLDLNLLSQFVDLVSRLNDLRFNQAVRAVRVFEKHSRKAKTLGPARNNLFRRLCLLVKTASAEDLATLRNLDEETLHDLIPELEKAIEEWIQSATVTDTFITNLDFAIDEPNSWWSKPFLKWIENIAFVRSISDAETAFLVLSSNKVGRHMEKYLTSHAVSEDNFLKALPEKPPEHVFVVIEALAVVRSWMRLHALCLLRTQGQRSAILNHVKAAGTKKEGLEIFYEHLGFNTLLLTACQSGEKILLDYIGGVLEAHISEISNEFVSKCSYWAGILASAIQQSAKLVGPLRMAVLNALALPKLEDSGFEELCSFATNKDPSLWLELKSPTITLNCLSLESRMRIEQKVDLFVEKELLAGGVFASDSSDSIRSFISSQRVLEILSSVSPDDSPRLGVNAFKWMSFLSDEDCCRWLIDVFTRTHIVHINDADCSEIAALLIERDYPKAARIVADTAERYNRSDVTPIYNQIRYKYEMATKLDQASKPRNLRLPKVVIATALQLERTEVLNLLGETEYDPQLFADVAPWPQSNPLFEIYVLETGAGNLMAQGALLRILNRVKPKVAFFVGVAGSVKDSDIGDVIYSTKVYYYEGGKEDKEGIRSRPVSERTSEALVQLAHRIASLDWQSSSGAIRKAKATAAVIASGEKVLSATSGNAATYQLIKNAYNDTQDIDMEAFGFLKAMRDGGVQHSMVIRGVSDKIQDKAESDAQGNQPLAAKNAATFLFALLRHCITIIQPKKKKRKSLKLFKS